MSLLVPPSTSRLVAARLALSASLLELSAFARTNGFEWLWGRPGALPKCLSVSRAFNGPRMRTVPAPRGERSANLSKVRHSPPAFSICFRAFSVNRRAHTLNFGTSYKRVSEVTVATTTAILSSLPVMNFDSFCMDIGGLFRRVVFKRLRMPLLNLESVRRARNLYNLHNNLM